MHDWTRYIRDRFASAGRAMDADVIEELAQHAAAAYESARAEGFLPNEAIARVDVLVTTWVDEAGTLMHRPRRPAAVVPPSTGTARMAGLLHDVRYALRLARRSPGPALVAAVTMALGIAATSVLFSVAWGVLMKPLPWPDADRLIRLEEHRQGATRQMPGIMTNGPYLAWSESRSTVEGVAAYRSRTVTMTGGAETERIRVTGATASLFPLLRTAPARGTVFRAAEETTNLALLSHALWIRRFGAREDVLGQSIVLDGVSHTIVGVMPRDFAFPDRETHVWVPMRVLPAATPDGGSSVQLFSAIARLKPGVSPAQAAQEATARATSAPADGGMAAMAIFGTKGSPEITAQPVLDALTADVRGALVVLLAAVALLLTTATANIASVQLARAATRRKELAVRAAIGAGNGRLARQMVIESLVVGVAGGALGLGLAAILHRALPGLLPAGFPRVDDIVLDWRIAAFAFVLSLAASLAAGMAPAIQARRLNLVAGLVEDASASGQALGRSRVARVRATIMIGQVAVACLLLVAASLLTRTFAAMLRADRGYDASNVLTARLATPGGLFTGQRRAELVTRTLERLRGRDDVLAAGVSTSVPLVAGDAVLAFTLPPAPGQSEPAMVQASYRIVSPGYLEAMGIDLLDGRGFDARDTMTSRPVLVVNRAFARKYLSSDAVGRTIPASLFDGKPDWEVIGIVDDILMRPGLTEPAQPELFVSYLQSPIGLRGEPVFAIRTRQDPVSITATLRQIVREQDPTATLESVMTMEERVMDSLAHPRLYAIVLTGFGGFALLIAGVGLFGVLSYGVAQRSKELGIRAALGARPGALVRLVMGEGLAITAIGAVTGMGAALVLTRWLSTFLYGIETHDAFTFVAVPLVLMVVSAAACFVPARRASRADPLRAMKAS